MKKIDGEDCRISDLLRQCSAEHHLLEIDSLESEENLPEAGMAEKETLGLQQFRDQSLDFLRDTLRL